MTSNPEDKIEDLQPDTDAADNVRGGPAGGTITGSSSGNAGGSSAGGGHEGQTIGPSGDKAR